MRGAEGGRKVELEAEEEAMLSSVFRVGVDDDRWAAKSRLAGGRVGGNVFNADPSDERKKITKSKLQ